MDPKDRDYSNDEITVHWRPSKCIHVTTCYKELLEVFNPRNRPWVNMDGAPSERIIEIVDKCPTGAITWSYNDKEKNKTKKVVVQEEPKVTEVKVMRDGPIVVMGNFEITGPRDETFNKMKMTSFCRCGASNNMPFCDGSHRKVGFKDED